jgi:hypothetical protein
VPIAAKLGNNVELPFPFINLSVSERSVRANGDSKLYLEHMWLHLGIAREKGGDSFRVTGIDRLDGQGTWRMAAGFGMNQRS